jgi:hypothetical protein
MQMGKDGTQAVGQPAQRGVVRIVAQQGPDCLFRGLDVAEKIHGLFQVNQDIGAQGAKLIVERIEFPGTVMVIGALVVGQERRA